MKILNRLRKSRPLVLTFLIGFMVATTVGLLIYYMYFHVSLTEDITDKTSDENLVATLNAQKYIDTSLDANLNIIKVIVSTINNLDTIDDANLDVYFEDIIDNSDYLESIEILDDSGSIRYNYPSDPLKIGTDLSQNEYVTSLSNEQEYLWTKPYVKALNDLLYISVMYEIADEVIIGNFSLEIFDELYETIESLSTSKDLMILNQYGIYIYSSNSETELYNFRYENFDELEELYINNEASIILPVNGIDSIISVTQSTQQDWFISIYESTDSSFSFLEQITDIITIIIFIIVSVYAIALVYSMVIIRGSLSVLRKSLLIVTGGEFGHVIEGSKIKEIDDISSSFNDMSTSLLETTERLKYLAYYDQLTEIYSRNYIKEFFNNEIKPNEDKQVHFINLDIARFHVINESFGYDYGDKLLIKIAKRLQSGISDLGRVARIEGDSFLIICRDNENLDGRLNALVRLFNEPFVINEIEVQVTVNIGVSLFPDDGIVFEDLITFSTYAITTAKNESERNFAYFDKSLLERFNRQVQIEMTIDKAFKNDEFFVEYQPIVDVQTELIRGFEALARWFHPDLGKVYPGEFVSVLENSLKIHMLDKYVFNEGVKICKRLNKKYNRNFVISVNISASTLLRNDFVDFVKNTLKKYAFDPYFLELELTETTFIADYIKVQNIMKTLKLLGVRFSEDDFGEGYSSLRYLTQLDLNTLKISRSFIMNIKEDFNNRLLVNTIIDLSKDLGFETIVEGVEDKEQLDIVKLFEPTYIQGFYYYKPMSFTNLDKVISECIKKFNKTNK
ncbi:EAL domain-containing protein [Candidatus Izimaplasma bacterium]|nr:EAL domain-containing protein [Candidatus Izimaplasma bacterium]